MTRYLQSARTPLPASLWVWLGAFIAIGVLGALFAIWISPPKFQAFATDYVSTGSTAKSSSDAAQASDSQLQSLAATIYVQTRMTSYAELATSDVVLARTIGDLRLRELPAQVAPEITATARPGSLLIDVSATGSTPQKARALTESIAGNLRDVVESTIEGKAIKGASLVRIEVVNEANIDRVPQYPDVTLLLVGGGVIGAVLWLGIVLILRRLTARLRVPADVSAVTDLPILARIPRTLSSFRIAVSVQANPGGIVAESVRHLRMGLAFTDVGDRPIVVTSSVPNEGKTTTAINLALAMALAGERVLLIDADLRRPSVSSLLNLDGRVGLVNVLRRGMLLEHVLQTWGVDSPFTVLPSGSIPSNPSQLIGSNAMRKLLAEASQRFDRVIIDTPPIHAAPDGAILSSTTGASIMVVGMGRVTRDILEKSLNELNSLGTRSLGLVLNFIENEDAPEPARRSAVNA